MPASKPVIIAACARTGCHWPCGTCKPTRCGGVLLQIRYHSSSQEPFSRLRIVCCRAALLPMPQLLSLLPSLQKPCFR